MDALDQIRDFPPRELVLAGIAASPLSRAKRRACIYLFLGWAQFLDDFVPAIWNRVSKALNDVRELQKDGHVSEDCGRIFLIESSFRLPLLQLPLISELGETGLGSALADLNRITAPSQQRRDGVLVRGPSSSGRLLSGTGLEPPARAGVGYALSCPGQDVEIERQGQALALPPHTPLSSEGIKSSEIQGGVNRSETLNSKPVQETVAGSGQAARLAVERELLAEYAEVCGIDSLATYGGAWRLRIRARPGLVRRLLADIRVAKREGRIHTDAGAAAFDLWRRWKGDCVTP